MQLSLEQSVSSDVHSETAETPTSPVHDSPNLLPMQPHQVPHGRHKTVATTFPSFPSSERNNKQNSTHLRSKSKPQSSLKVNFSNVFTCLLN